MNLHENDLRLEEICRFIEKATNQLQDLSFLVLKIELLDSFENLNKASPKGIIKSPAAYQCSEERIIVNSRIFLNLEMPIKVATIMHEVAHAYLHLINPGLKEREFKDKDIDEELIADYLVCDWGFEEQSCGRLAPFYEALPLQHSLADYEDKFPASVINPITPVGRAHPTTLLNIFAIKVLSLIYL